MNEHSNEEFVLKLSKTLNRIFIKNSALIHVFLNNCGLIFEVLHALMGCIKRSPSICVVHLSNNRGIETGSHNKSKLIEKLGFNQLTHPEIFQQAINFSSLY